MPPKSPHKSASSPSRGLRAWLDERTGYSALVKLIVDEPIPGGARWWYVFGSVLVFLLGLEFLTGILLAGFYAPTVQAAWASTAFIQDTLTLGWFVRGLHSFGSSALIVLAAVHLAQVVIFGAYKAPREMTWLSGVGLLGLLLLFALSGYGLPWDEEGYAAKVVDLGFVGVAPVVGPWMQTIIQGGNAIGNYTVTHIYLAHTLLFPGVIVGLVLLHIVFARRHGKTPRWATSEEDLARTTQPHWPYQSARNAAACGVTFVILAFFVIRTHGAQLLGPADPTGSYQARPEWYMLPLYQLRKFLEGPFEMAAVLLAPAVALMVLGSLPWLDSSHSRDPHRRKPILAGAAFAAVMTVVLGYLPLHRDAGDPEFQRARAEAAERATLARTLAKEGVLPEGGMAVYRNDPQFRVRELWHEHCANCHGFTGEGGKEGPDFKNYNSRAWIEAFLRNPSGPLYMGGAKLEKGMKPVEGTDHEIRGLAELIYAETGAIDVDGALVEKARPLLSEKDCDSCHDFDGTGENSGPNLKGRGTLAYMVDVIADAGEARLFGKKNKMPRFAGKLSPEEIGDLARFILTQSRK